MQEQLILMKSKQPKKASDRNVIRDGRSASRTQDQDRSGYEWEIDPTTREIGRRGIAAARAALAEGRASLTKADESAELPFAA